MSDGLKTPESFRGFSQYEKFLSKELTAGTEGLNGLKKADKIISNMLHNLKAFSNQIENYFAKKTENEGSLSGKWVNNQKIFKHINKNLESMKSNLKKDKFDANQLENELLTLTMIAGTIDEMQTIFKSMDKMLIADKKIEDMRGKLRDFEKQANGMKENLVELNLTKIDVEKLKKEERLKAKEEDDKRAADLMREGSDLISSLFNTQKTTEATKTNESKEEKP